MEMTEAERLKYLEINPPTPAKHAIIWLHGLGADGSDFVPIAPQLQIPAVMATRFVFPHAPTLPVTINQGHRMPAWYDIISIASEGKIDYEGIARSVASVQALIDKEIAAGIPRENIVLAGFSQGAVIALLTAIYSPTPISGVIALSGYLPLSKEAKEKLTNREQKFPVFMAHGSEDAVVPYALGKAAFMALKNADYPAAWHNYDMGHSVCMEELQDISNWIQTIWHY